MKSISYRQVHLDFHTSEYIPDVGKDFDKNEFADTLEKAHVDSVTCFARCHHGWLYYPSRKYPELIHPNLKNHNLLPDQIEACHERNIKVPVYTTVQWDGRVMREHKEWLCIDENGQYINTQGVPAPHFYDTICLNSGYREFFKDHLSDLIMTLGPERVDGIFMDILFPVDCHCDHCRAKMKALGMDSTRKAVRLTYSLMMLAEFKKEITAHILTMVPGAGIFYNSSHVGPASRDSFKDYSHLELESLPSGGWGYDHFPATVRYARNLDKKLIGMTGKFHTYWGDFHSLKNQAALELECFQMLSQGAGCSIGDQLHPSGKLSAATYALIGQVYQSVSEKEPYCTDVTSITEIAVLNPEEFYPENSFASGLSSSLIGAVRMLTELACQFDIIDTRVDFSRYPVLILPDCIYYTERLEQLLKNYLKDGGKIIGSYDSCLNKEKEDSIYGVVFEKESEYEREFILPNDKIGKELPKEEFVMYQRGYDVSCTKAEILMDKIVPYFERKGETFCSHQHAPSQGEKGCPAVTQFGNSIYFSHPVFHLYRKNAARWCKIMVKDALEILLPRKLVSHDGPSSLVMTLQSREKEQLDILHGLHYITEKRSEDIYTVEDVIPLSHIHVKIDTKGRTVKELRYLPSQKTVPFQQKDDFIFFELEKVEGHEMVGISYL